MAAVQTLQAQAVCSHHPCRAAALAGRSTEDPAHPHTGAPATQHLITRPSHHHVSPDEVLDESLDRFILFPIKHHAMWEMHKKAEASFWTAQEIDLADDAKHWPTLTDDERFFIEKVLAFFASSDNIVAENLLRVMREVQLPEARAFYSFQNAIEFVHVETYSLLIQSYVKDAARRHALFQVGGPHRPHVLGRRA
jgi:ribonucleotide reductase beta subunit family protein with ferritin-like domain